MSRRLKAQIDQIEQEINVLAQVAAILNDPTTSVETVRKDLDMLGSVRKRMLAAMPVENSEPKPEPKKRSTRGLPKPNGKGKEATQ